MPNNKLQVVSAERLGRYDDKIKEWVEEQLPLGPFGHVIEDKNGTDMTNRSNLQFTGVANITDDSTNDRTIVNMPAMPLADIADIIDPIPTPFLSANLGDLGDVNITNPTGGEVLVYDDINLKWINSSSAEGPIGPTGAVGDIGPTGPTGAPGQNATTTAVVSTSENGLAPKVTSTSGFLKGDGTWATPTDTNTHRPIQMNGTEILGNNATALNLNAGSNVTLTNSSGTVTIAATDTTYSNATTSAAGLMSAADKTELIGIRTGADGTIYSTAGDSVRGQITDLNMAIQNIETQIGEDVKDISTTDPTHATTSISGDEVEITLTGVSLFSGYTGAYVNATLKGFYISGIASLPATLGLVFGKDASNNVYYLACVSTGIGDIFQVTPSGGYTRIMSSTYAGSNFNKVVITDFVNGVLSFDIYNTAGQKVSQTRDVSSYNINTPIVGFIPYNNGTNTLKTPLDKYNSIHKVPDNPLNTLLPKLVNKSTPYRIKLIGDSITAGVGGTGYNATSSGGGEQIIGSVYTNVAGHCWANSLKSYLETKFSGVTVKNYGYSGATAQFLYENISNFVSSSDDLVICMIGTNNRATSGDLNRLYTNLQNIINYISNLNISLILLAPIPASVTNEATRTVLHMEDINMINNAVAKVNKVNFISVYDLMKEYLKYTGTSLNSILVDGLHPNDTGYDIMYYLISNALGFTTPIDGYTWTPSVLSS